MNWKGYSPASALILVTFLLAFLPMIASGDPQHAEVDASNQKQEPTVATAIADGGKANQVCFGCHDMSEKSITLQSPKPQKKHREVMKIQRPCTDCHNKTNILCCHDNVFPKTIDGTDSSKTL